MIKHRIVLPALSLGLVLLASGCGILFDRPSQRVKSILKLAEVPTSFQEGQCEYWGFTDVLETCFFRVEPKDFPKLLTGREFKDEFVGGQPGGWHNGRSHSWGGGPKVGPDFKVEAAFVATPEEFEHGGHVRLVTDKQHSMVQVDIYIE